MLNIKQNKTTGIIAAVCASYLAIMQLPVLWRQISSIFTVLNSPVFENVLVFQHLVSLVSFALVLLLYLKLLFPFKNHLNILRILLALCVADTLIHQLMHWNTMALLPPFLTLLLQLIGWQAVLLICSFLKPPRAWPALISFVVVRIILSAFLLAEFGPGVVFSMGSLMSFLTFATLLVLHPVLERPIFPLPREADEIEPEPEELT